MVKAYVVQCAAGDDREAERLAAALLDEGLAACVQLSPIRSRYVWKGKVEAADEVMLSIKTRADLFEAVRIRIRQLHSYETPEILAISAEAVDADYLVWLEAATAAVTTANPGY
jgi:uncharacterized protein involved in tolerance to divalent cations